MDDMYEDDRMENIGSNWTFFPVVDEFGYLGELYKHKYKKYRYKLYFNREEVYLSLKPHEELKRLNLKILMPFEGRV